jgi:hypothetical protein
MMVLVHRVMRAVERLDCSYYQQPPSTVSAVFLQVLFEFYKFFQLTNDSTPPVIKKQRET